MHLVTAGIAATVVALVAASSALQRGNRTQFNKFLRYRVAAQGLTVIAALGEFRLRILRRLSTRFHGLSTDCRLALEKRWVGVLSTGTQGGQGCTARGEGASCKVGERCPSTVNARSARSGSSLGLLHISCSLFRRNYVLVPHRLPWLSSVHCPTHVLTILQLQFTLVALRRGESGRDLHHPAMIDLCCPFCSQEKVLLQHRRH